MKFKEIINIFITSLGWWWYNPRLDNPIRDFMERRKNAKSNN